MPIITSIKPQKNKKRVNIFLDNKFGFGLDLENYMKLGLQVEQELSDKEIDQIVKKANFKKTLDNILRYATLRPRSEREIKDWLRKKRIHQSIYEKLINKLVELELLDDVKFAQWWINQRIQFRNKSKRELIVELRKKGINKNTIDDVFAKLNINEKKSAKELIRKNRYRWSKIDDKTASQKKAEYLARKGFPWDVIKDAV